MEMGLGYRVDSFEKVPRNGILGRVGLFKLERTGVHGGGLSKKAAEILADSLGQNSQQNTVYKVVREIPSDLII